MNFTNNNLIKINLLLSLFFLIGCKNEELKDEVVTRNNNAKLIDELRITADFNNQKIINKKGKNYIYKNEVLSQITVYENINNVTTDLIRNDNTAQFKSLYSNNQFKLKNIDRINEKVMTFDLYLNDVLFEKNIKLSSNIQFSEIDNEMTTMCGWLCGIIIKEITDAAVGIAKEDTCSDAIEACEDNGGLPQLSRGEEGCEVQCTDPDSD